MMAIPHPQSTYLQNYHGYEQALELSNFLICCDMIRLIIVQVQVSKQPRVIAIQCYDVFSCLKIILYITQF